MSSICPADMKVVCRCTTKTGSGIVFPGYYLQVTVEQLG